MIESARDKARQIWNAWRKEVDKQRKAELLREFHAARAQLLKLQTQAQINN